MAVALNPIRWVLVRSETAPFGTRPVLFLVNWDGQCICMRGRCAQVPGSKAPHVRGTLSHLSHLIQSQFTNVAVSRRLGFDRRELGGEMRRSRGDVGAGDALWALSAFLGLLVRTGLGISCAEDGPHGW